MYGGGRSDPQQQWTVHAEFTIKHDGLEDRTVLPRTRTERDENGVRMVYTWSGSGPTGSDVQSPNPPCPSKDPQLPYGFQRGNLVFTSTPPPKPPPPPPQQRSAPGLDSSGYGSELLSPISGSIPYRPQQQQQPYNRRCRSTCSIVLSTDFNQKSDEVVSARECGRTQSLRCQTPTVKCERKDSFYGCGDPWCYHGNYDDSSSVVRFPPLQECDEYVSQNSSSSRRPSRASTYATRHSSAGGSKVKDASVQTFEMIDKCTSPFMRSDFSPKESDSDAKTKSFRKKSSATYNARRKTEPTAAFQRTQSPSSSFTPDSLESQQPGKRSFRAHPNKQAPKLPAEAADPNKKPRTVHIDVYCTGTEQESSSSCSDSENKTASSPQTVFESGKFKLTHKKVTSSDVPHILRKSTGNVNELKKKFEKEESDDDGASTAYPSQLSSFSAIKDFASSLSSVPPSWSTISMSSCAIPDDDSVANTSWKDTYSDLASLLESRSSIAQTDSLDFVPRKLLQGESIEEYPEIQRDLADTPSKASLQPSDSFEYANSEDRVRIKQMEQMLQKGKQWKSPHSERKHLLQQKKLKEYLDKRRSDETPLPKWTLDGKDSESEGTDSEEKGWSIVKPAPDQKSDAKPPKVTISMPKVYEDQGSLSDSSPTSKSPSGVALKQRLSSDPKLGSPFTIVPGIFTEQREVAERFGRIVDVFKKPGHHVGPAKNPDCTCEHCRRHFEVFGMRDRARSWGDSTASTVDWKEFGGGKKANKNPPIGGGGGCTDF